jgi:hypothetical protein
VLLVADRVRQLEDQPVSAALLLFLRNHWTRIALCIVQQLRPACAVQHTMWPADNIMS